MYIAAVSDKFIDVNWVAMPVHDPDEERYYLSTCARNDPIYKLAKKGLEATSGPSIRRDGMKEARGCLAGLWSIKRDCCDASDVKVKGSHSCVAYQECFRALLVL